MDIGTILSILGLSFQGFVFRLFLKRPRINWILSMFIYFKSSHS